MADTILQVKGLSVDFIIDKSKTVKKVNPPIFPI